MTPQYMQWAILTFMHFVGNSIGLNGLKSISDYV